MSSAAHPFNFHHQLCFVCKIGCVDMTSCKETRKLWLPGSVFDPSCTDILRIPMAHNCCLACLFHTPDSPVTYPYILTYRSRLFSHIFRPKTRVRPIQWSYLSENFHQVGTKAKLISYCVHALVHAHTKTTNGTRSCTSNYCLRNQTRLSSAHAALQ